MAIVVDRRDQTGNSTANRQRFLQRNKGNIKKAIDRAISGGDITDIGKGGVDVTVPKEDLNEPSFRPGQGGVHPVAVGVALAVNLRKTVRAKTTSPSTSLKKNFSNISSAISKSRT